MISKKLGAADLLVALFYCTLTIKYMRVLARFVFRCSVLCLDACFLVLGAFYAHLERLQVFRMFCGSVARVLFFCVLVRGSCEGFQMQSARILCASSGDVLQVCFCFRFRMSFKFRGSFARFRSASFPDPLRYIVLLY